MTRTKFTTHGSGAITIEYDDAASGLRQTRTFARYGHYVHEIFGMGAKTAQVCEKLAHGGVALMADDDERAIEVVRREFRRMMRSEKREAGEWLERNQ